MFKNRSKLFIWLLVLTSSPIISFASHIIGGRLAYKYLGNNKYQIKLLVYRDCSDNIDFDNPATVTIFDKPNSNIVLNRQIPLANRVILNQSSPNPCFLPPPGICVEQGTYLDTVTLASNPIGYTATYQRFSRNATIGNIVLPQFNGISVTVDIPPQINNTPNFLQTPPIYVCLTDTFNYSFAANDVDGDSLVYSMCTPLIGASNTNVVPNPATPPPYMPIQWASGYSQSNQIANSGGITFNTNTGQLKFKPSLIGQFAVGICISEYRNGNLININRLEMQFNVVMCWLVSSIPTATNLCQGLAINFNNSSTNSNNFFWNFGDPTTLADTSHAATPIYTFPTYGTYTITLIATNSNYGFCKDTAKKVINVHPLLSPTLQPSYQKCFKNNLTTYSVGGIYQPSTTFNWNFTSNSSISSSNNNPVNINFTTPTTKTVSVIINQFGCIDTLYSVISFSNPIALTDSINLNCNERALNFGNFSLNASNFKWDFGVPSITTDTSNMVSPSYTYYTYGNYTITLIASDGSCFDTLRLPIKVFPKLSLNYPVPKGKQCFKNNSFDFSADGDYTSNTSFNWLFGNNASDTVSHMENPSKIHFKQPGTYAVWLTISESGCSKSRRETITVLPDPKANMTLSDNKGCEPFTIKFKNKQDSLHPAVLRWNINDSIFSDTVVYFNFPFAGVYSYSLLLTDNNKCTDTIMGRNSIVINQTPKAKMSVNPKYASILNPQFTFIDSTQEHHYTNFYLGDGSYSNAPRILYNYKNIGQFDYTFIASTEHGCADTLTGSLFVDDIGDSYVPNVFTPNGDGVNERFCIKGENITASDMTIFNRWGGKVFETTDALAGWDGIEKHSGRPCSDGTYMYVIKITLGGVRKYSFNGALQLVR